MNKNRIEFEHDGTFEELQDLLKNAGFEVIDTHADGEFHAIRTNLNVKMHWDSSEGLIEHLGKHADCRVIMAGIREAMQIGELAQMSVL